MKEIYKTIKEYPDYAISNLGNVKSKKRVILHPASGIQSLGERILKQAKYEKSGGYICRSVYIKNKNGYRKFYVHQLVAKHFVKNPLKRIEVNHIDNDPQNNVSTNLEWVTHYENMMHAKNQGRIRKGEKHGRATLTESDVLEIRTRKLSVIAYAKKYNTSERNIYGILRKETWKHVA